MALFGGELVAPSAAPHESLLAPLDRARGWILRHCQPLSSRLAADRVLRVQFMGAAVVAIALALTLAAPLWTLALGPIILGVPHLLADLRYSGFDSGLLRRRATRWVCGLAIVAVGLGVGLWAGLVGVTGAFLLARGSRLRRGLGAVSALALALIAWSHDAASTLALAHAHNFVAIALWWAWRPRRRFEALFVVLVLTLSACLIGGVFDSAIHWRWSPGAEPLEASYHMRQLAPGMNPTFAARAVALYAFAQVVHYGLWIHMIRDDARSRQTPPSFRASYRRFCAEFGPWLLWACALACAFVIAWAIADLAAARVGYFRLAQFHGALELCAGALIIVEGRPGPHLERARPRPPNL